MEIKQNFYKKIEFKKRVRIKEFQLEWLRKNKGDNNCKTMAQFLDKIINQFKKNYE